MDHDLVVEPADGGEVVGVGPAVVGPRNHVVDLQAVSAGAAGDGASCGVAVQDEPSEAGWDDPAAASEG
ncbi:MAG: hypothetical protein WCC01_04190, partial [Acidimicrobiia bacterium]